MKRKLTMRDQTLGEAFGGFILSKRASGCAEKTLETYISHFNAVTKYIDDETILDLITTSTMKRVFAKMSASDLSRNSIRSYSATFKSFFNWCREVGLCDVEIALFKGEESVPELYTFDELKRLLKHPNRKTCTFADMRAWAIVNLLVNDGCRAGTIRMIQNRDVHLDDHAIFIRHTKSRKAITIPLNDSLEKVLCEYMNLRGGNGSDWLFPELDGTTQMSESALRTAMNRYNKRCGVDRTGLHKYRHTFARMYLVECGGDAFKLQKLLGHSTLDMTKHYTKIFDRDIIEDFQKHSPLDALNDKKIKMPRKR